MKTFSLKTTSEEICIQNADGKEEKLEMREMNSGARDSHLNQVGGRALLNGEGKVIGVKDFEQLHSSLLSRCLWRKQNGKDVPVSREEIDKWPSAIVDDLYKMAQEMNHLNKTAEEQKGAAKNA